MVLVMVVINRIYVMFGQLRLDIFLLVHEFWVVMLLLMLVSVWLIGGLQLGLSTGLLVGQLVGIVGLWRLFRWIDVEPESPD